MNKMTFLLSGSLIAVTAAASAQMSCGDLTPASLGLQGVTFDEVIAVPAGEESPAAQCRIRATTAERVGTDGQDYALKFELALPDNWNGDYVHQFNGGNDGEVKPAKGSLPSGTGGLSPLERGYAVVSSDAGHNGKANRDKGLAAGAVFGHDFEARQMYGYKAVAVLDPLARDIVEGFYGADIDHAYGVGCSNGGRHAMVAAARMPDAFDGLLAGAPGFQLPKAALQHALDVQQFTSLTGDLATAFSREDLGLVSSKITEACDGLDGLEDGYVADSASCQATFDITALTCTAGQNSACLSADQVNVLQTISAGTDADGAPYYSDWAWDTAIGSGGWRFWKLESPIPPWGKKPIIAVMGSSSLAQVFTTPPTEVAGDPDSLVDFLKGFDLQARAQDVYATTAEYPESAMEVMTPPGSDDPKLAEFKAAGGKFIVFHGVGDPVFSANATANWYDSLNANNSGDAGDFVRYYPVSGMAHCSGGATLDQYDLFEKLVDWVEKDEAPEAVVVSARADNKEVPEALKTASRLLCPAPKVARYTGGDAASSDSFTCQ